MSQKYYEKYGIDASMSNFWTCLHMPAYVCSLFLIKIIDGIPCVYVWNLSEQGNKVLKLMAEDRN